MTSWAESDGRSHGTRRLLCRHCGRSIRSRESWVHPWVHVETGRHMCAPITKAEPMTLQEKDAVAYVDDLVREAGHLADRAAALLDSAQAILKKLACGETYNL